jgi:hypothetical protein
MLNVPVLTLRVYSSYVLQSKRIVNFDTLCYFSRPPQPSANSYKIGLTLNQFLSI